MFLLVFALRFQVISLWPGVFGVFTASIIKSKKHEIIKLRKQHDITGKIHKCTLRNIDSSPASTPKIQCHGQLLKPQIKRHLYLKVGTNSVPPPHKVVVRINVRDTCEYALKLQVPCKVKITRITEMITVKMTNLGHF